MKPDMRAARADGGVSPDERRVLAATLVGTAIEWYDYFIYAQAAALVLGPLFFAPLTRNRPELGLLLSYSTIGIAFLFRPLGAIICGYLGDRFGRKIVLVATLVLMGVSTALIGVLPTFAQIGIAAPVMLVLLRILQGFSAGGEWGGAALLAVEHAPREKRGLFGAFPQIGTPVGLIMATLMMLGLTSVMGRDAFAANGWRVSFLLSLVLILVGWLIRRRVEESPVFALMHQRRRESAAPLRQLFRNHSREVILAALIFVGNNAGGYLLLAFLIGYGQTALHLPPTEVLIASTAAAFVWLLSTLAGGILGDRLGQVRTFQIGYAILALWAIPMWFLLQGAGIGLFAVTLLILAVPLGLTYGPQAALYANMFPARVRYSGVSIGYALGSILGGAFAPTIAQGLLAAYGAPWLIGAYLTVLSLVSLVGVSLVGNPAQLDAE